MFKREEALDKQPTHSGNVYHCYYAAHSQKNYMNNRTICSTLSITIPIIK